MTLFRRHCVFSCAMLSGVSWAILHRVFACAMLSQEYYHIIEQDFFYVKCFLEALGKRCTRFLPVQCCPKSIKTTLNRIFFLCNVVWSQFENITQSFYLCNVVPKVLRQHWTGFFPVQCCLEALGQHCTRFLPVQRCPRSIKTTLNRIP